MAKVKIQAGTEDEESELLPPLASNHKRGHHKHIGAVALLRKSLHEKGILSWYQVRIKNHIIYELHSLNFQGNERSNH